MACNSPFESHDILEKLSITCIRPCSVCMRERGHIVLCGHRNSEAILTGEVVLPPSPALLATREKGSLGKSIGPSATSGDALEAFQR